MSELLVVPSKKPSKVNVQEIAASDVDKNEIVKGQAMKTTRKRYCSIRSCPNELGTDKKEIAMFK